VRPGSSSRCAIRVDIQRQTLSLIWEGEAVVDYPVSTGANGHGCEAGSYKTPIGWHRIKLKIGEGQPAGTVFVRRRPTGEVFTPALGRVAPSRDWILTRILWLDGLEPRLNRGEGVDTLRRFIYIHGTPDECMANARSSHGCVRMFNADVIDLFSRVEVGTRVLISADGATSS
jgi:L,D-transpeptidase YbiS